jgi:HSP20 family protein
MNEKKIDVVKDEKNNNVKTEKVTNRNCNSGYGFLRPFFSFFNDDMPSDFISSSNIMRTDIKDDGKNYRLDVELPGIDKKNIKIGLEDGYLTVTAHMDKDSKEETGKYLHSERITGSYSRSYFVGYDAKKKDVTASLANGVLTINVVKPVADKDAEEPIEIK